MNPEVKNLLNAIGALAEECAVFYKSCIAQEFTPKQAMDLTETFIIAQFAGPKKNGEGE